ncbi:MAG: hypothetical protein K0R57_5545 [Paenibacillaceae bacterium]|jgi:hypothetical protein|nr:hypothetical protein [Paenibacillaceae bacterium]
MKMKPKPAATAASALFRAELFQSPPASHHSIPLWSWNDRLEEQEVRSQVKQMKQAGLGGFIMHARSGLATPYMGEEWMAAVGAAVEEASAQGMEAWCYDENGWPSGTANGEVPALGRAYQQKWLEYEELPRAASDSTAGSTGWDDPELLVVLARSDEEGWRVCRAGQDGWKPRGLDDRIYDGMDDGMDDGKQNRSDRGEHGGADCGEDGPLLAVYARVNPHYVDILHPQAIRAFLEACHARYEARFGHLFGGVLKGIFSDEFKFKSVPWSDLFPGEYTSRFGRDLFADLPYVLGLLDGHEIREDAAYAARYRFWSMVSAMFKQSVGLVGDWCRQRSFLLTGHIMAEDDLQQQMGYSAGVMPLYEEMDAPGIDCLGRKLPSVMLVKQASSVARQLDKPFVLTETFGCGGWNLTFETMKHIGERQFVLGVNRLSPHLQGYSMKGIRKRDYPPSIYVQQPWWPHYHLFESYFARLSYALTCGEADCGVLVVHPIRSAWLHYAPGNDAVVKQLSDHLEELAHTLLSLPCDFDFGDEELMAGHGSARDGLLRIGRSSYHTVILPHLTGISRPTLELLRAFAAAGGKLIVLGCAPRYLDGQADSALERLCAGPGIIRAEQTQQLACHLQPVVTVNPLGDNEQSNGRLWVQKRICEDGELLFYCVNMSENEGLRTELDFGPLTGNWFELCALTGQIIPVSGPLMPEVTFAPGQSRVLLYQRETSGGFAAEAEAETETEAAPRQRPLHPLSPSLLPSGGLAPVTDLGGGWMAEALESNALTLDYAKYRFSGNAAWSPPAYVLNIQALCLSRREPVPLELEYEFELEELPEEHSRWQLGMEDRSGWTVLVNGAPLPEEPSGCYRDHAIQTFGIGQLLREGRNTVRMSRLFQCNEDACRFFDNADPNFAPVRNKLIYETEIESIYILGPFTVKPAAWGHTPQGTLAAYGPFRLQPWQDRDHTAIDDLTAGGYWFYAGAWRLTRKVELTPAVKQALARGGSALLRWDRMTVPLAGISVNGGPRRYCLWQPFVCEITEEALTGEGSLTLTIELVSSCRNLFGPHHHLKGELGFVGPTSFTDRIGWVDAGAAEIWTDRYSFVKNGLENLRLEIV